MNHLGEIVRFICAVLTPWERGNHRESLREKIRSGTVPWERVVEISSQHFVITSLWSGFFDKGLAELLPQDLIEALKELHRLNGLRNDSLTRQIRNIIECLNAVGLEPLLLKGSALLATSMFPDAGDRFMADIDLLVPEEMSEEAIRALIQSGYRVLHADNPVFDLSAHLPPLEHPSQVAQVELHTSLASKIEPKVLSLSEIWGAAQVIRSGEMTFRIPSPSHSILYNLFHTEIHHRGYWYGALPLKGLYDFAQLSYWYFGDIDWSVIESAMAIKGIERVWHAYLFMAHSLFGAPVPLNPAGGFSSRLHLVRCVAQISNPLLMKMGCAWGSLQWGVVRGRLLYAVHLFRKYRGAAFGMVLKWLIHEMTGR